MPPKLRSHRPVLLDELAKDRRQRKMLMELQHDQNSGDSDIEDDMDKNFPRFEDDEEKKARLAKKKKRKPRFCKALNVLVNEELAESGDTPPRCDYLDVRAAPSKYPERPFCSVCGFPSTYTCPPCGSKYCSIKCLTTHKETRCMKWTA